MPEAEAKTQELRERGVCVLRGVIEAPHIDATKRCVLDEYAAALPHGWTGGGQYFGHINYFPRPGLPLITSVLSSAVVRDVVHRILGDDVRIVGLVGNANLPGSVHQPAHADGDPGLDNLVINIALGDASTRNGSTEVWPSTHLRKLTFKEFSPRIGIGSERVDTTAGDVAVRYPCLWHRGTPNPSSDLRMMLGIIVSSGWRAWRPVAIRPEDIASAEALPMPIHSTVSDTAKVGFQPNYFKPTAKGRFLESMWVRAPWAYSAMRRI